MKKGKMKQPSVSLASLIDDQARLVFAFAMASFPKAEDQVCCLIEAELRNYRLIHKLEKAELEGEDFRTNLHPLIFPLPASGLAILRKSSWGFPTSAELSSVLIILIAT